MGEQNTNQVPQVAGAVVVNLTGSACITVIFVVDFFAVAEQGRAA